MKMKKIDKQSFRNFLAKYTTHPIPTEFTLRKNYLTSCYDVAINKIRNCVGNKIWVSIDETTDVSGRFVANVVVVGILKDDQPGDRRGIQKVKAIFKLRGNRDREELAHCAVLTTPVEEFSHLQYSALPSVERQL